MQLNMKALTFISPERFIELLTESITSKQIFSPSLSQSNHNTKWSTPRASLANMAGIRNLGDASFFSVGQEKSSSYLYI